MADRWWWGAAAACWRLWAAAVRVVPDRPRRRDGPVVYACLHRDILPAILYVAPVRPVLLVSNSRDGDLLVRCLGPRFGFVRGSTGKAGGQALRRLLRELRRGRSVGIAVDGPRGPFGTVHEGVLILARLAGCPIVPLRVTPGRHTSLRNWDRTVVPWPGSRIVVEELPTLAPPRGPGGGDPRWSRDLAAALLGGVRP